MVCLFRQVDYRKFDPSGERAVSFLDAHEGYSDKSKKSLEFVCVVDPAKMMLYDRYLRPGGSEVG